MGENSEVLQELEESDSICRGNLKTVGLLGDRAEQSLVKEITAENFLNGARAPHNLN